MPQEVTINNLISGVNEHISQVVTGALRAKDVLSLSSDAFNADFNISNSKASNQNRWQLMPDANNVGDVNNLSVYNIDETAGKVHATAKYKASWNAPMQCANADLQLAAQAVFEACVLSAKAVNFLTKQEGVVKAAKLPVEQYMSADSRRKQNCYALTVGKKLLNAATIILQSHPKALKDLKQADPAMHSAIVQSQNFVKQSVKAIERGNYCLHGALEVAKNSGMLANEADKEATLKATPNGLGEAKISDIKATLANGQRAKNEKTHK